LSVGHKSVFYEDVKIIRDIPNSKYLFDKKARLTPYAFMRKPQ